MAPVTVRSRWRVPASEMSEDNIVYLIKALNGLLDKVTLKFLDRDYKNVFTYEEIKNVAREGIYRAILKYDPIKGGLDDFAEYYCWAWINAYARNIYRKTNHEVPLGPCRKTAMDNPEHYTMVRRLQAALTDKEYMIVEGIAYGISIKKIMMECGISTRHQFIAEKENAIRKARSIL